MRGRIDGKKGGGISQTPSYEWSSKSNSIPKSGKFIKKFVVIRERSFPEECAEFCALDLW